MAHELSVVLTMYRHSIEHSPPIWPQILVGLSFWSSIIGTELQSSSRVVTSTFSMLVVISVAVL